MAAKVALLELFRHRSASQEYLIPFFSVASLAPLVASCKTLWTTTSATNFTAVLQVWGRSWAKDLMAGLSWKEAAKRESEAAWLARAIVSNAHSIVADRVSHTAWIWIQTIATLSWNRAYNSVVVADLVAHEADNSRLEVLTACSTSVAMRTICCGVLLNMYSGSSSFL